VRGESDGIACTRGSDRGGARGQACVVPLVEETEEADLKAATAFANAPEEIFPDLKVGLVPGG
jgi:RecG-like helicase